MAALRPRLDSPRGADTTHKPRSEEIQVSKIRRSPGVAVGVVALVIAMAGGAVALPGKNSVKSNDIAKNAVKSKHIKSVKSADLGANSVAAAAIANGAVGATELADGAVSTAKLGNGSVTEAKLSDDVAGEVVSTDGAVEASAGETKTLFTSGPFTVKARCTTSAPDIGFDLIFASTEAQTVSTVMGVTGPDETAAHFDGVDTFGPGDGNANTIAPPAGVGIFRTVSYALMAPSGATLTGNLALGSILNGVDCSFSGHGVS
jgi:hypothetical protein